MKNHLGEREYKTYPAWQRAVKAIDSNALFDGTKDICYGMTADGMNGIGEWTGETGTIYHSSDDDYIPVSF